MFPGNKCKSLVLSRSLSLHLLDFVLILEICCCSPTSPSNSTVSTQVELCLVRPTAGVTFDPDLAMSVHLSQLMLDCCDDDAVAVTGAGLHSSGFSTFLSVFWSLGQTRGVNFHPTHCNQVCCLFVAVFTPRVTRTSWSHLVSNTCLPFCF